MVIIPIYLVKWSIFRQENLSIARQKFCYLVVLNDKFLTQLASDIIPQIEQVLSQIGISFGLILLLFRNVF